MTDEATTPAPAKPVALRMRLGFDSADAFEQGYRRFVTAQGIFLASRTPRQPGTSLRFELQTRDGGTRLLVAEGRVVGVRPADPEHPKRVPGMHVRFTRLTEESRLRIHRMTQSAAAVATGPTHIQPSMPVAPSASAPGPAASGPTDPGPDPGVADSVRAPKPAPVDVRLQAELRQIAPPTRSPSADGAPGPYDPTVDDTDVGGHPPGDVRLDRLRELDLPDPGDSPFKNVFDRLFGMGEGAPPDEDPFDLFLQADLPTADGDPLEDVLELPPDAILR